jgi:hypothetical protein
VDEQDKRPRHAGHSPFLPDSSSKDKHGGAFVTPFLHEGDISLTASASLLTVESLTTKVPAAE